MPVVFGEMDDNGKVRVASVAMRMTAHPEGYSVDEVPDYPPARIDVQHVMLYDPSTGEIIFAERQRDPNELAVVLEQVREDGREEIRSIVRDAAALETLTGPARQRLVDMGVLG